MTVTRVAETCTCRRFTAFMMMCKILWNVCKHLLPSSAYRSSLMHGDGLFTIKYFIVFIDAAVNPVVSHYTEYKRSITHNTTLQYLPSVLYIRFNKPSSGITSQIYRHQYMCHVHYLFSGPLNRPCTWHISSKFLWSDATFEDASECAVVNISTDFNWMERTAFCRYSTEGHKKSHNTGFQNTHRSY